MSKAQELEEAMAFLQATLDGFRGSQSSALEDENPHLAECFQEMHVEPMERAISAIRSALSASSEQQAAQQDDDLPDSVLDAVAAALGDAYDCGRVWSAWSYGTMGPDDFSMIAEDGDRVAEIARAAIDAARASNGGKAND